MTNKTAKQQNEEQQKGTKQLKKSFKTFSKRVNVKLPKVELPKFDGSVTEWMSFRDFFGNAVHRNSSLSKIDKFTYLKASLTGKAAETIAGLPLTSANYDSAWGLLEKQIGDKQRLIANFMKKLVKISSVAENRDVARLRGLLGQVEVIIRGLQSLSVDESTFGSLLIPILLEKLPEDIKLQVTRLISSEIWDLRELLQLLSKEIEAREKCAFSTNRDNVSGQSGKPFAGDYTTSSFVSKTQENGCVFCSGQHSSHRCLVVQSPQERKKKLMQNGRCFRCLSSEHLSRVCKVERGCFKCGQKHHQAIWFKIMSKTRAEGNNSDKSCKGRNWENSSRPAGAEDKFRTDKVSKGSDREQTSSLCSSSGTLVLFETAVTGVSNGKDEACRGRILLDKCSQQSYITEEFAGRCRLKVVGRNVFAVNAFGSNAVQQVEQNVYEASIQTLTGKMVVHLVGMNTIFSPLLSPCNVHAVKVQHRYLSNLQLAYDFNDDVVGALSVNVLIGSDFFYNFVTSRVIVGCYGNKLSAVSSKFGWVLSGPLQCGDEQSESSVGTFLSSVQGADTLSEKVESFWNLESLGIKTEEDTMLEDFRKKTVTFNGERYVTKLPWNGNEEFLQDHKKLATSRIESTTRSIIAKGRLMEYDDVLREQVGAAILEEVPEQDINTSNSCHYSPHHAVITEDKATTKLRVVLDGAAWSSKFDFSINDCLSKSPNLLVSLFAILLRFMLFQVTVLADIEKAFLQVCVHQDDIDALRILWYKNPFDRNRKVAVFEYLRVVFGFVCSPFLLNATIRYHLQWCLETAQSEKDKVMQKSLIDSFYVDDLTLSIPTVEEAERLISLSEKVIGEAGMRLRKWVTNRSEVSKFSETKKLVESISEGQVGMKVLGLSYQVKEDEIHFDFSTFLKCIAEKDKLTKRIALGVVSSVYDPLGLVSAVVVELKLAIQDLWKRSLGWDDVLSEESGKTFQEVFREWRNEMLVIPRQYVEVQGRYGIELHSFVDASQRLCAVACYGRAVVAGEIKTFLIASKTKLSSLKSGTIPRLELVAALLAARLSKSVEVALGEVVRGSNFWSDLANCFVMDQSRAVHPT